jgi:prolyl-tRNA synthetase
MARDMKGGRYAPLRAVQPGDPCIACGAALEVSRTIEVGHIFKLGTRYSEALGAHFLDETGAQKPIIMGSYGIGIERIMACAIESRFDGSSMVWPREIAPFLVEILPLNTTHDETRSIAERLYTSLSERGTSVLLDDRDERAGVKFKDADLLGSRVLVVIGERNLMEGMVELRVKDRGESGLVKIDDLTQAMEKALRNGE